MADQTAVYPSGNKFKILRKSSQFGMNINLVFATGVTIIFSVRTDG